MIKDVRHIAKRVDAEEYIAAYRDRPTFLEYCKVCPNYGTLWVCPPYGFDISARINRFKYVYLLGSKVVLDDDARRLASNADEHKELTRRIIGEARKSIDRRLLELEGMYCGSLAFFAGSCLICHTGTCARLKNRECVDPAKARPSLEAYGFDITRTAAEILGMEIKWSEGFVLPPYFTLVSGLFTDSEAVDSVFPVL